MYVCMYIRTCRAVHLQYCCGGADPVVPRRSSGVALVDLLAGGSGVGLTDTFAEQQFPHILQNVCPQLFNHSFRYCTWWSRESG